MRVNGSCAAKQVKCACQGSCRKEQQAEKTGPCCQYCVPFATPGERGHTTGLAFGGLIFLFFFIILCLLFSSLQHFLGNDNAEKCERQADDESKT